MLCKRIIAILVIVASCSKVTLAQDECELILTQATEEFNAGHLTSIAAMLKDCLDKNQRRDWRQRAYLLLAETYLLLEDPANAEQSYLNVLRANPEYITDPSRDPIDLVYLSGKFTATPIFSFHGYAGPNITPVRVIHDVHSGGEPYAKEDYSVRLGWQVGAGAEYNYNDYLSGTLGANFSRTTFKQTTTNLFGMDKDIIEFVDRQNWLTVPISVKYTQPKGKWRRYGYVGLSFNYLMSDNADIEINNRDAKADSETEERTSFDKSISNVNLIDYRNRFNYSFFIGGGVKYKYKLDYFYFDLRYTFGMKNVANPEDRYNSLTLGLPYPYIDDDFRIDNLAFSVGYIRPFYKPRKLQKARTKSVLRKIEKEDNETN
ncbi:MAG TPA: porin family protein [Chryseolinea sp.]|nr:porin family protein [Chryseolinea sp.]